MFSRYIRCLSPLWNRSGIYVSEILSLSSSSFNFFRVKGKYGTKDKFTFIISLVFFQCIFNAIVSKVILIIRRTDRDTTPSKMYAISSFTYLFAMLASNYALEFVSYPMQVDKREAVRKIIARKILGSG